MKKLTFLFWLTLALFVFTSCSKSGEDTQRLAKVTKIDGTEVTLQFGEMKEETEKNTYISEPPSDNSSKTDNTDSKKKLDDSSNSSSEETEDKNSQSTDKSNNSSSKPPEKPEDDTGEPPEKPDGDSSEPPEKPSGEMDKALDKPDDGNEPPDLPDDSSGTPPEKPDGSKEPPEKPDNKNSDQNSDSSSGNSTDQENSNSDSKVTEKPNGENADQNSSNNTDSDQKSSNAPGGLDENKKAPEMFVAGEESGTFNFENTVLKESSGGETKDITLEDLKVGSIISVEMKDNQVIKATLENNTGAPGAGNSDNVNQGSSATTINKDGEYKDTSYDSSGEDENALRVEGATVSLDNVKINKSGGNSSSTEDGDFYGMNAALLATDGANVTIKNSTVNSNAQNGNGIFSYGTGTAVNVSDTKITTESDNSGGIQTAGGAQTSASNLEVNTSGNSSAAIRSDRGGGTVTVDGGSYTSNGYNSPAIYSTAKISVKNAKLTANNSESLVVEGKNSISLENTDVVGNMSDTKGSSSDENVHNVFIYQSMSGDASEGTSSFSMKGGNLTSQNGDMFFVTNTDCKIDLSGVNITNQDSEAALMRITGNSANKGWGKAGKNGGNAEVTVTGQTLEGNIIVDSISTLNLNLKENSNLTGTINIEDNKEGGEAVNDNAVITIDKDCVWTLTGDCKITSLTNNGTINYNGHTITLADGTVLNN